MPLWIHWIILGLVAGTLAKFLVPGRDPAGCIVTIVLGIAGAMLGGWIGSLFGWGRVNSSSFSARSVLVATLGAIVLLLAGRLAFGRPKQG
ncbi:MAG TPA: GlsB/YeaQ/YmgE family stress response membrane protein [Gemmatimonadaceae bacterium]|nr:GlsB/YeaQ/YmgE family stress response membrane protein [Gemmatimonadaceae bacterium]